MALSKTDQVRFEGLKQTVSMLLGNGIPLPQIKTMMAPQILEFQESTNNKVVYVQRDDGLTLELINLSKDFLRVRGTDDTKVLRAKIFGVPIDIKVQKLESFNFTNEDIAAALRAEADEIDGLSVELNTLELGTDLRKGDSAEEGEGSDEPGNETEELEEDPVQAGS